MIGKGKGGRRTTRMIVVVLQRQGGEELLGAIICGQELRFGTTHTYQSRGKDREGSRPLQQLQNDMRRKKGLILPGV